MGDNENRKGCFLLMNPNNLLADGGVNTESGRNGFIELCKFVFSWGVVSHHSMFLKDNLDNIPLLGGYISVEFFFILTGYFMCSSYRACPREKNNAVRQVYSKFKRFYPYFLVAWCTVFILKHIENGNMQISALFWDFILGVPQFLFLQCTGLAGGGYAYNGPTWFISALLIGLLIIYPLMCMCREYFVTAIAPVLCLVCYGLVIIINGSLGSVHEWVFFLQAGTLRAIGGLCLGSFCCYIVSSIPRHSLTKFGDAIMSFLQVSLMGLSLFLMSHIHDYGDTVQIILFSLLIIISFEEDTTLNRLCNAKVFFVLGKLSMIIFVTQHIAYCSPDLLFYPQSWPWRYGMYIIYVLSFSLLNYLIVENIRRRHMIQKVKRCLWETNK